MSFKTKFEKKNKTKKPLTNRLAFLLIIFQSCKCTASPLFQQAWVGEGLQPSLHAWARRWASDCRLALAERWLWHSSASRAKEEPSQWEPCPTSFSAIHSNFYLYVCFFTCRWPASMAQSCGLHPRAKQVVLSWLSLQASWLAHVYLGCCYLCEVGSLFHMLPAVGCWLFAS